MARPWNSLTIDGIICTVAAVLAFRGIPPILPTILVATASATIHAAGTVLNDYTDIEVDKTMFPNRPLALGAVKARDALLFWLSLSTIALGIGWVLDIKVFLMMLLLWFFGIWYSWWPRVKDLYPYNELMVAAISTFEIIAVVWAVNSKITPTVIFYMIALFILFFLGRQWRSFIDYQTDLKYGKITLPVKVGVSKSSKILAFSHALLYFASTSAFLLNGLRVSFYVVMLIAAAAQLNLSLQLVMDPSPENTRKLYEGRTMVIPWLGFSIAFVLGALL